MTLEGRANQYRDDFVQEGRKLMCKFCRIPIDWHDIDNIKSHLGSLRHSKSKYGGEQAKIEQFTGEKNEYKEIVRDFIIMMTTADIPLKRINKMKPFLVKHCINGGSIPCYKTLREKALISLYTDKVQEIKGCVKNKEICLLMDSSSDKAGRHIVLLMAVICHSRTFIVIDCGIETGQTAIAYAEFVKSAINSSQIKWHNAHALITDSAEVMKKPIICLNHAILILFISDAFLIFLIKH